MFTLDSYAARSCPLKTFHALNPHAVRPEPRAIAAFPGATEFTASVYDRITTGRVGVADLRPLADASSEEQEQACLAAMDAGTAVILGGLLPRDWANHRRGRAEVLIRRPDGGYAPGLIKFQRALDVRRDDLVFDYSPVADLTSIRSDTGWRYRWHWRWANALQLAHLWLLLQAAGRNSAEPVAAVIGTDRLPGAGMVATWLDLAQPCLSPAYGSGDPDTPVSALVRYQQEFAGRVELARAAVHPPQPPVTPTPIVTNECTYCDWWSQCRSQIGEDDISLRINKSPLDRAEISGLRAQNIWTIHELAEADIEFVLEGYLPLMSHRQGAEERLRLAQRRARMLVDGIELERTTTGPITLPRAEIEIDIDVETSRDDRVYLWGFWVADAGGGHYQHFSSFTDLDDAAELELAATAMTWLRDQIGEATARIYHYSDYEVNRLVRLARSGAEPLTWAVTLARTGFVDLFEVVRQHYFGANGLGLKAVASAGAGFHWRDDDPGGLNSMIWFDTAVHSEDPSERALARERVLCYNEDDVRATARLREWLRQQD